MIETQNIHLWPRDHLEDEYLRLAGRLKIQLTYIKELERKLDFIAALEDGHDVRGLA